MSLKNSWDLKNEYTEVLNFKNKVKNEQVISHLIATLPFLWAKVYCDQSVRNTDLCRVQLGTFEYVFDDSATLEKKGLVPINPSIEPRLVAAFGISVQALRQRDDYRLRNWVGPTNAFFGNQWDKGHFIAHSIGGSVDRTELNIFPQRRNLNRGWSNEGKLFRKMEKYCSEHPGTFCFNRPIYTDHTSRPSFYEFGVLKSDQELWIESFDNR